MFRRNLDFFAVALCALMLGALSQVPSLPGFRPWNPVRFQTAMVVSSGRMQQNLDAHVNCFQKRMDSSFRRVDSHMRTLDSRMRDLDTRLSRILHY